MLKFVICTYKCIENDRLRNGIAVLNSVDDVHSILDDHGNRVDEIWNYTLRYHAGCAVFDMDKLCFDRVQINKRG